MHPFLRDGRVCFLLVSRLSCSVSRCGLSSHFNSPAPYVDSLSLCPFFNPLSHLCFINIVQYNDVLWMSVGPVGSLTSTNDVRV